MTEVGAEFIDGTGSVEQPVNLEVMAVPHEIELESGSRFSNVIESLRDFKRRAYIAGAVAIVGAEVLPVNEAMRYGAAGATQAATGNSLAAAAVFGISTLAIEGLAAESTGHLMGTQHGEKVFKWLHDKTQKVVKGRKMSLPVEASVAYFGGSAVVMSAKQIENPDRSKEEIRKHGRFTAAWLSGVLAVQWGLTANSIDKPTTGNIAAAVATTVGAGVGVKIAQKRSKS